MTTAPRSAPDLEALTGVRSGKTSYYRAYVRSDERIQRTVQAMDSISRAVVRTVEGPRGLLEEVVRAASTHLAAEWTLLALRAGDLTRAKPRFLVLDAGSNRFLDTTAALPETVRDELDAVLAGRPAELCAHGRWVRVPLTLEGREVGSLCGLHGFRTDPEPGDLTVLRILANQAAVSLHTSEQYLAGMALHRRAQQLYAEVEQQARDLEARTDELRRAEQSLVLAHQRELIDAERHRIARELHDSVTQYVLSAGMAVEVARGEAETIAHDGPIHQHLATAKGLSQQAVEQLRRAIYALSCAQSDTLASLPELLSEIAEHHRPHLQVQLRVAGQAVALGVDVDHEIARVVGEAMFNVALHARATRAVVRLRYRPEELMVSVADDGDGDPVELRRLLRLERGKLADGRHRGLANMETRVADLGGTMRFRRSRIGGVRVEVRVPLPLPERGPGLINQLVSGTTEEKSSDAGS